MSVPARSDEEIMAMLTEGSVKPHALEKLFGPDRGVSLRRQWTERSSGATGLLADIPFSSGLDYSTVVGQCAENVVGFVPIPLGLVGPVAVNGVSTYIPMATTEGCLIASTHRGCKAINLGGGCSASILRDGMTRGPILLLPSAMDAVAVAQWSNSPEGLTILQTAFNSTTRFGRLQSVKSTVAGRNAFLRFEAFTGDAMGMNMISKGTQAALAALKERFPAVVVVAISGNYCCDKKPAAINWVDGRGKSVVCEAVIPRDVVASVLKTTPEAICEVVLRKVLVGSAMAAAVGGFNAHAANIVAALYLACGQDPAQVVESANCITLAEVVNGGDLHFSVSMPSIEVGTIGGGTQLAAQAASLSLMGVRGANRENPGANAKALATKVAAAVLGGELSLLSALATGDLVKAHMEHNRRPAAASEPRKREAGECLL